jgi:hypothetical protein
MSNLHSNKINTTMRLITFIVAAVLISHAHAIDDDDSENSGGARRSRSSTNTSIGPLSANQSVLTFAANAAVEQLQNFSQSLFATLSSSLRKKVNPNNHAEVLSAVMKSSRNASSTWKKKVSNILNRHRVNSAKLTSIECNAITNNTNLPASAFLGQSVILSGALFVDLNCDGILDSPPDILIGASGANPQLPNASAFLLEIIQSTSDVRLKRIVTFVPVFENSSNLGPYKQAGMYSSFFPTMLAFQSQPAAAADIPAANFDPRLVGVALYANEGEVQAPISFLENIGGRCVEITKSESFNNVAIDLRLAFAGNPTGLLIANSTGLCLDPFNANIITNDDAASLIGGVEFLDSNFDGIRNPMESLIDTQAFLSINAVRFGKSPGGQNKTIETIITQKTDGSYLRALASNIAVISEQTKLTVTLFSDSSNGNGTISDTTVCGATSPSLGVGATTPPLGGDINSFFINQFTPVFNESIIGIQSSDSLFRLPTLNIGLSCSHQKPVQNITVQSICSSSRLTASQTNITDTFLVTVERGVFFQTWLSAVTARPVFGAPINDSSKFTAVFHGTSEEFRAAFNGTSVTTEITFQIQGNILQLNVGSVDDQRLDVQQTNASTPIQFNISIIVPYAELDNFTCAGIAGQEIVSELVLSNYDGNLGDAFTIGQIGGICSHRQPPQCVNGTFVPISTSPQHHEENVGEDGTVAIVASYTGVALVIIFVFVAVGTR